MPRKTSWDVMLAVVAQGCVVEGDHEREEDVVVLAEGLRLTKNAHQVGWATQSRWPEKMEWVPILRGCFFGSLKMERRRRVVIC